AVVAQEAFGALGEGARMWLIGITAFGVGASAVAVLLASKKIVGIFSGLDSGKIGAAVVVYLLAIILLIDGAVGLFVAAVACCIGVLPPLLGVRRTHLMGLILLPSILYHAGLGNFVLSLIFGS
ncbi:MAG: hypothetical protein NT157_00385, partial [Candidatus Micrarchaeota archaeon]|nr:hypothetical protein [Candidatus Micrarchaeota archaeon]